MGNETLANTHKEDPTPLSGEGPPEPALYVVLEGERPMSGGLRASLKRVREVRIGRGKERSWSVEGDVATLAIPDPRMSGRHARLVNEDGGWLLEDVGSTNGTWAGPSKVTADVVEEATMFTMGATVILVDPAEPTPAGTLPLVEAPSLRSRPRGTATLAPSVEAHMPRLVRVSMSKLPVLLLGESGAGKEVLARTVHQLSGRSGPFVAINCGALAPTLVESQLFGYVRGAFSGALKDEPGLVRSSSGGTLFLDEIGELPAPAQATLLRVLQEHEVLPVGATKPVPVDLRVVAATLRPIDQSPTFRPDLYARVAAYVHRLVPLRDRRGDLGLLVADLLPRLAPDRAPKLRIAPDFVTALAAHPWTLNVRELEHALSVALVTSSDDLLRLEHAGDILRVRASELPSMPQASSPAPAGGRASGAWTGRTRPAAGAFAPSGSGAPAPGSEAAEAPSRDRPLTADETRLKDELVAHLTRTRGNISEISRTLGKTRMQIHRWMKRFGITPESFRE